MIIRNYTRRLVWTAMMIALGLILPFITMQVPKFGNMLCPMHIPVLLVGFLCGGAYGIVAGAVLPIFRSFLFGAPILIPTALTMSFELATYGLLAGAMYHMLRNKKLGTYISLILAMIGGRIVYGIVSYIIYHILGNTFTWKIFVTQAFVNALPGIILQLLIIPAIVKYTMARTTKES